MSTRGVVDMGGSWRPSHLLRRALPPAGQDYELFDLACVFWVIVLGTYAIAEPSPSTSSALQWLVGPTPLALWSIGLNLAALTGLICSFAPPAVRIGRGILFLAGFTWCAVLLFGWLVDFSVTDHAALTEGLRMGAAFAAGTAVITTLVQAISRNKTWARAILAALPAAAVVFTVVLVLTWSGDPRPFGSAVLYGFFARTAYHQTHTACRAPLPYAGAPRAAR